MLSHVIGQFSHFIRPVVLGMLVLITQACGGGGGGGQPEPETPTPTPTPPASYTVSTSAGTNGGISPASVAVEEGKTTSFTISADTGYTIDTVSGCNGVWRDGLYETDVITANCSITVSFKIKPVGGLYSANGVNWNDYILNDGSTLFNASDTAATGTETGGYNALIHAGEIRSVDVPGKSNCAGITADDELGAFNWQCIDSELPVRVVSTGLKADKNLSDLISFIDVAWKQNRVTVYDNGSLYWQTPLSAWWGNPVIADNDGSDGRDMSVGDIRIINSNPGATYMMGKDKVALVVNPAVTLNGSTAVREYLIRAGSKKFLWLEGNLENSLDDHSVVLWTDVFFSVIKNVHAFNGSLGPYLMRGGNNLLINNKVTNISGILLNSSVYNTITGNKISRSGIALIGASDNNTITSFVIDNGSISIGTSRNNIIRNGTISNSSFRGIRFDVNSNNNILMDITISNAGNSVALNDSSRNYLSGIVALNSDIGLLISAGTENIIQDFVAAHNDTGIRLRASNNIFTGQLWVGNSNTWQCYVEPGSTDPGLDDDSTVSDVNLDTEHLGICKRQGQSDFVGYGASSDEAKYSIDLTNSHVGKVGADDSVNISDTLGTAIYPVDTAVFDWSNFVNIYRSWGKDGSAFPNADNRMDWTTGTGRIWDWTLNSADTVIMNYYNNLPTGDDTVSHSWFGTGSVRYLKHAVEILGDKIGNDNGLCESDESCLYTPNIGGYQGHGNLISAGTFEDGVTADGLTGITLMKYETNGVPVP